MIETFLRTLIRVYTPLKAFQERAAHWAYSWIPYFIYEVEYNPFHTQSVTHLYNVKHKIPWSKIRCGKLEGTLSFRYWNQETQEPERMILHTDHLQKALHTDSMEHLWAFSEEGVILMVRKYIHEQKACTMVDIRYGETPLSKEQRSLIPSLCIPQNVTPATLALFLDTKADASSNLVYSTEDTQEEVSVKPTEYIIS